MVEDRFTVLYYLASSGIPVSRIGNYMYLYQRFISDLQYRFKIGINGVQSKPFQRYLDEELSKGNLVIKDNTLYCTKDGLELLNRICFSVEDLTIMSDFELSLESVELQDLEMLVVIDMVMNDMDKQGGVKALVNKRETVEKLVGNVCGGYTPSKFVLLVEFLSKLEESFKK